EGLVTTAKNKGFLITEMTAVDLEEQTQVRQLLECPAMHAIAGHVPEEDYAPLRESADVIVAAAEQGDLHTYLSEDRTFHARLVPYTGTRRRVETTTQLRGQTRLRALRALPTAAVWWSRPRSTTSCSICSRTVMAMGPTSSSAGTSATRPGCGRQAPMKPP